MSNRMNEMTKKVGGVLKPGLVCPKPQEVTRNTGIVCCALMLTAVTIFLMDTAIIGLLALM